MIMFTSCVSLREQSVGSDQLDRLHRSRQPEDVEHVVHACRLVLQPFGSRDGADGVTVAVTGGDVQFNAFSEHAKHDGVLPRVITDTNGVVADFIAGSSATLTFAAVYMFD